MATELAKAVVHCELTVNESSKPKPNQNEKILKEFPELASWKYDDIDDKFIDTSFDIYYVKTEKNWERNAKIVTFKLIWYPK